MAKEQVNGKGWLVEQLLIQSSEFQPSAKRITLKNWEKNITDSEIEQVDCKNHDLCKTLLLCDNSTVLISIFQIPFNLMC